jgi:inner membrane protein
VDPVSQGVLGAAVAMLFSKPKTLSRAAACGAIGGMAPDLDVFIRSNADPLLAIEYHRHFTHSLFFVPFGGLLVAIALWLLFFRKTSTFWHIYLFTTLGLATHGLLDVCTSYGTRLYWPLSNERVSWNVISIIDPIFTIPFLGFVIAGAVKKSCNMVRIGFAAAMLYLGYGYIKHEQVAEVVEQLAASRGHIVERMLLNPTIANNRLWRAVYQADGNYYVDAVLVPPFEAVKIHEGTSVPVIDKETIFPEIAADSLQRKDILRFAYFSQDYIYIHPSDPTIISDLRYGTLPHDTYSMWGIRVNPDTQNNHAQWMSLRNFKGRDYDGFWNMLKGDFSKLD